MIKLLDLTHYRHLPAGFNVSSVSDVQAFVDSLFAMNIDSEESLIEMMERYSDLLRAVYDEDSLLKLDVVINNCEEEAQIAYFEYKQSFKIPVERLASTLEEKFYNSKYRKNLTDGKYSYLDLLIANKYEISGGEYTQLESREYQLAQKYNCIERKLSSTNVQSPQPETQPYAEAKAMERKNLELSWLSEKKLLLVAEYRLNDFFEDLCIIRTCIAQKRGFTNYRDYMHIKMERLAYMPYELISFHTAIEKEVMPFVEEIYKERVEKHELGSIRPWDIDDDLDALLLKPFQSTDELAEKTVEVLEKIDPGFAQHLQMMDKMGLLNLDYSKCKCPEAHCYPLFGLGSGIIYMSQKGSHVDIRGLLHECGHAMHFRAMRDIPLYMYQNFSNEVAELASLSMELLSMDHWDVFYPDPADLRIAKKNELEHALLTLPLFATVDAFQHWAYTHPEHSVEERRESYLEISARFSPNIDWSGLEEYQHLGWIGWEVFQKPFCGIDYGIAQLGALRVYMNYRQDKQKALQDFQNFLAAGYSKPMNELYQIAGIELDFSEAGLREIINFVKQELAAL